jgi:hypothetical protein
MLLSWTRRRRRWGQSGNVSGGRARAEAIPCAQLVLMEGMGHGLLAGLRSQLAARIAEFVWCVEGR